jgi:hypothetical protein
MEKQYLGIGIKTDADRHRHSGIWHLSPVPVCPVVER